MHINPTQAQQAAFLQLPDLEPICMINLLKFKAEGKATYLEYMKAVTPLFEQVGGKTLWVGEPLHTLIGPEEEGLWDMMLIAQYPNKMALMQLGGHPDYPGQLRSDALEDSRLIVSKPLDAF